ncbi:sigma 54-interacting transcriptional regulator [Salinicoccus siamensis]|uniref:Sigma 54-interacting transcriptional regulator n=2 Tax=Salinicoccus siamensis TaxID=381830 RepID=A0ABV5Z4E6_9STAP
MKRIIVNSRDFTSLNTLQSDLEDTKRISRNYHMELEQIKYREIDSDLIARDSEMEKVIRMVMRVAPVKSSVLIQGEAGVGQECHCTPPA